MSTAGLLFVWSACFFTPLSTSLLGVCTLFAAAVWLLSGGLSDLPRICRAHPSVLVALLLFGFMAAALSYSPVSLAEGLATLRKYRELLLMPVIFSILSGSPSHRSTAQHCFLAGCIVLMAASYLIYFNLLPEDRYGHSLVFHITHSFFMAVLGFWALQRFVHRARYRYGWLLVSAAAAINLFYIAPGRTGMFVFCCLALLFSYQRLSLARWSLAVVLLGALMVGAYHSSENFSKRVDQAREEILHYEAGQSRTSIGQRFDWWLVSIRLIKEKPVFGHGTGSFAKVQQRAGTTITATDNPHNEYLLLAVQFGLVGAALFILLVALQLYEGRDLGGKDRQLLQGVILALLAGSLMNSLLFDSQQGHFYLLMTAALLAGSD